MDDDQRFREALREQAEQTRRRLVAPPTPDEVLAYVERRLAGAERERVADGIAAFPEATRLARDLARFPAVEADGEPEGGRGIEAEAAAAWGVVRARLEGDAESETEAVVGGGEPALAERGAGPGDGEPGPGDGVSFRRHVGSHPTGSHAGRHVRWWAAAAAVLAVAAAGAGYRLWLAERPQPNPEVRTLQPRAAGGSRGAPAPPVQVPRESGRLILVLAYAGPTAPGAHALAVREERGEVRWSTDELRRRSDGTFTVSIPRRFLGPGDYVLELRPAGEPGTGPIAVYDLAIERAGDG